jgi:predicted MFS family arabinose efflux permease
MGASLHVSQGPVGFLVSVYALASFLSAIPLTAALRGLPRRPVLIGVLVGFALFNAVTAFSSSYPLTFVARLLAGVMGGTLWAMLVGYAARMVPAERRGRAIAIVLAGITVALSLGIPVGTAVANAFGWRTSFAALAALAAVLVAWVSWKVPNFRGEPAAERIPLRRIASMPGIPTVLVVTLLLLLGHQAMYTYMAPFAERSGFGHTSVVLFVFGIATVAGIWIVGTLIDRHLRPTLLGALALVAAAMLALGRFGRTPTVLLIAVALWGAAFGGAPTLLQTALVDASSPGNADVATSMQATVYNLGIAAGSLAGGIILESAGAGALPWTALPLAAAALATVTAARRHAFPAHRPTH